MTDAWDGRGREKTFRYRSPSRAVSAVLDPDRTLLLDLRQTNNGLTLAPRSGAAARVGPGSGWPGFSMRCSPTARWCSQVNIRALEQAVSAHVIGITWIEKRPV